MPRFTFEITEPAVLRLQAVAARYNADNGQSLTVTEWLSLHLRELAIQDELVQSVEAIRRQKENETHAAVLAERDRLMGTV